MSNIIIDISINPTIITEGEIGSSSSSSGQ